MNSKKDSISSTQELESINNQSESGNLLDTEDATTKLQRSVSVRPETPLSVTHNADFDDDDEEEEFN